MAVKLGTNPIAWTNDDMPELGGATPLETCLKDAAEAGFAGIEKGGKFPNDAAQVRAAQALSSSKCGRIAAISASTLRVRSSPLYQPETRARP